MSSAAPPAALDAASQSQVAVSRLRVFTNRLIFRTMLFTMGSAAVLLHLVGRNEQRTWRFAKARARTLARVLGVTVHVRGLEHLDGKPCVFVSNHRSHFDIAAILGFVPGINRFTAKKELFREPVLGLVMRTMGMIPVDREHPEKAIERLRRLQHDGHSLVFFPEGTRSRDGMLAPFKKGAFVTAIELGLPVVPIACRGSERIMPAGGYLAILPGEMELEILEPIATADLSYEQRGELANRVRARIAEALG
ncbi:MAG TPA: lysophospholipid acyltransferase family protein [Candidatus Limnocylindrales bacterium]|nr:lysophospholipid acyltransferase family protein [Candidatus Limnocylindrales bacterium]